MISFTTREYLSTVDDDERLKASLQYHRMNPKKIELKDFKLFSNLVSKLLKEEEDIGGWYLGTDLQVVPDFDVLWYGENYVLNIDLKDEWHDDTSNKVIKKFDQQTRIFRLLSKSVRHFAFDASTESLYEYNNSELINREFTDLVDFMQKNKTYDSKNLIDDLELADYLVSPLNDVKKFLDEKYFLTQDQKCIEDKCLKPGVFGIKGIAGSGKSLIAYDIAKKLNNDKKNVLFIFSGTLREGHSKLNNAFDFVNFVRAKDVPLIDLNDYDFCLVDEAQRLYTTCRKQIVMWVEGSVDSKTVIFFYDVQQTLSYRDSGQLTNSICESFAKRNKGQIFTLTNGLRSNPSIHAFIRQLFDLSKIRPNNVGIEDLFTCIDIKYFKVKKNAFNWISDKINEGFKFIVPTPSSYNASSADEFEQINIKFENTHHTIGEEYDNVVTYIDENVKYTERGILEVNGRSEYYNIDNEFYVNMSRAKKHLSLAIIGNDDLYKAIMNVIMK